MSPSIYLSKGDLIGSPRYRAPHVVLLGAGASKAAFPHGDKNGRRVPLMDELPCVLGDAWLDITRHVPEVEEGFEAQFTWLRSQAKYQNELSHIEQLLYRYFQSLKLPDHPTYYDYLVLGLREKDIIATFNWDPFLLLSYRRNKGVAPLPDIRFLHGCVCFAGCKEHDTLGFLGEVCPKCGQELEPGKLLFPDQEKDYATDHLVWKDWCALSDRLRFAFHLTIFGYSGPLSDFHAKELMLGDWSESPWRKFSHVEVIDTACRDEIRRRWKSFIPYSHEMIVSEFFDSTIAKWPRRTAEYKLGASVDAMPSEKIGPHRTNDLEMLQRWHRKIVLAETSED